MRCEKLRCASLRSALQRCGALSRGVALANLPSFWFSPLRRSVFGTVVPAFAKWGQTLFFKPCFSASAALSSFCTSTFATLPLKGSKLWEIMQFSSQSESVEHSAMDVGTPLKNGV